MALKKGQILKFPIKPVTTAVNRNLVPQEVECQARTWFSELKAEEAGVFLCPFPSIGSQKRLLLEHGVISLAHLGYCALDYRCSPTQQVGVGADGGLLCSEELTVRRSGQATDCRSGLVPLRSACVPLGLLCFTTGFPIKNTRRRRRRGGEEKDNRRFLS